MELLKKLVQPLRSRKVRVALATVLAGYAAQAGLGLPDNTMYAILTVGTAVILGIAIEDNGVKSKTGE